MEESEKRKERLRAMRMEADQAEVFNNVETSGVPGCLSNPLIQASQTPPVQENFYATPRFDYYTDPMSAFSASKRKNKVDGQTTQYCFTPPNASQLSSSSSAVPWNPEMSSFPVHQMQKIYSHDSKMYQAQGQYSSTASHGSPRMRSPLPMHQGIHGAWHGSSGRGSYHFPSNPPRGSNSPSPGFAPVRSPNFSDGQGRPQWFGYNQIQNPGFTDSPGLSFGRGRGRGYGGNIRPGMGRGGRGPGFHGHSSGPARTVGPECFFDESMLVDPWKHLEPVPWRKLETHTATPGSSNSWLPKSISTKKARVSEASNRSSSQPSLAEYLAASFNKAVNNAPST